MSSYAQGIINAPSGLLPGTAPRDLRPFAALVVLHGPLDPSLIGHQYRIRGTNVDAGGTVLLTSPFTVFKG